MADVRPIAEYLVRCGAALVRQLAFDDLYVCEADHEVTGKVIALAANGPWRGHGCPTLVDCRPPPPPIDEQAAAYLALCGLS